MSTFLKNLPPGTRVRVVGLPDTATLIRTNECRAIVREDGGTTEVEFTDADGAVHILVSKHRRGADWV